MSYNKAICFINEDLNWTVLLPFLILISRVISYMQHEVPGLFSRSDDEQYSWQSDEDGWNLELPNYKTL
jgi:hypothetical protein